jgi:hypothetical protein
MEAPMEGAGLYLNSQERRLLRTSRSFFATMVCLLLAEERRC